MTERRGSAFDGTWRPDPQRPGPDAPPEELLLADGVYACTSCDPPYRVAADGRAQPVEAGAPFDTLAVRVVDDRTVHRVGRRSGELVVDATTVVSADGNAKTETRTIADMVPRPVMVAITAERIGEAVDGAHLLSGRWRVVEMDMVDHDEDTTFEIAGDVLSMRDRLGRSFQAPLDGTPAAYHGDPRFSAVSVRWIDPTTIEERDLAGDEAVFVALWHVDTERGTMHVRFDDLHGRVMEQDGRRL